MGNGNRPTPEFRREAVRLALTSGRIRREIAEDLGHVDKWRSQRRIDVMSMKPRKLSAVLS